MAHTNPPHPQQQKEKIMKDIKQFSRGVFWTLFIGMAAWIAFDVSDKVVPKDGYTTAQREAMNDVVALSLEDLK